LTGAEATGTLVAFVVLYIALLTAFGFVLKWMIEGELERMGVKESADRSRPQMPWVKGDD